MSTGKVPQKSIIAVIILIVIVIAAFWLHSNAMELGLSQASPLCGVCH